MLFFLLHCFFVCIAFFGTAVALIWLYREANENVLRKVMYWTLIVGIVGSLVTAPFACLFLQEGYYHGKAGQGMMMNWMEADEFAKLSPNDRNQKMQERMEQMMGTEESEVSN